MAKLDTIHSGHGSVSDNEDGLHFVDGDQGGLGIVGRLDPGYVGSGADWPSVAYRLSPVAPPEQLPPLRGRSAAARA